MLVKPAVVLAALTALAFAGTAPPGVAKTLRPVERGAGWRAPRTAFGQPDLQGLWSNATLTPFEREASFGERRALTAEEARKIETSNAALVAEGEKPTDPKATVGDLPVNCGRGFTGTNCGYNTSWTDPGTRVIDINGEKRASILTEPANGRLPPRTPDGQRRAAALMTRYSGPTAWDGPESRALAERCLMSFGSSAGPPMLGVLYNNTYNIVQTPDTVMIQVEMVHDVRMIRLNKPHDPANIRKWMGDSVGHWEGDTLVIETINQRPEQAFRGVSPDAKIIERLTRIAPDKILYQFRVEDPNTYTAAFAGESAFNAAKGPIYEYACHEGNYALPGILAGARENERKGLPPGAG